MFGYNGALRGKSRIPSQLSASGIWDCGEQCDSRRANIWPITGGDPYWANVSLLLHMDGSNGSTTFTDSSSNNFTISAFGDAQVSTTDPKFGTGSLTLDGTGDYLTTPADTAFAFGTGDFTVECWVYANSGNSNDGLFTFGGTSSGLAVALESGNWRLTLVGSGTFTHSSTATTGVWTHIAATRNGTNLRFFVGGVSAGTVTNSTNLTDNELKIGYYYNSSFAINAKIDEFRVTKGVARYTANFTPPTAPFPDA
jgi:hypothetical protein